MTTCSRYYCNHFRFSFGWISSVFLILCFQPCATSIIDERVETQSPHHDVPAALSGPASEASPDAVDTMRRKAARVLQKHRKRKAARFLQASKSNRTDQLPDDDFGGSDGCPCIDSSPVLSTISNCITEAGSPGFSGRGGTCYPINYGATTCGAHDMIYDPLCLATGNSSGASIPSYCSDRWCFVDYDKCKMSEEFIYRSSVDFSNKQDLFYSYSTCSSTAEGWLNYQTRSSTEGITLVATVPRMLYPDSYKLAEDGTIATDDSYYYNDDIPWTGSIIDYLNAVVEISNMRGVKYTSRSASSDKSYPESFYTATAHDVTAGLGDMGGGNFWITSQRLAMTTYTTPFDVDRIELFIRQPETKELTIRDSAERIALPFTQNLWILLLFVVLVTAMLIVWLDRFEGDRGIWNKRTSGPVWDKSSAISKIGIVIYSTIESFIIHSAYMMGHATEFDISTSLAQKVMFFGFSVVIFVAVSAYTANLAAFLTLSGNVNYISNMEEAIATNTPVCANPLLEDDLTALWPEAKFVFNGGTSGLEEVMGMMDMYDAGECGAIGYNMENTLLANHEIMEEFCKRDLVSTKSYLIEKPLAFPIRSELSAGLSYWMYEAEKESITYNFFQEQRMAARLCNLRVAPVVPDITASLNTASMILPTLIWICCIVIVMLGYLFSFLKKKKSKHTPQTQQQPSPRVSRRISYLSPRSTRQWRLSANFYDDYESEKKALSNLLQQQHAEILKKLSDMAMRNRGSKEREKDGSEITFNSKIE